MIIFISDLHLTDGTFDYMKDNPDKHIPHDISSEAFKLFWDQVYRIYKASKSENKIKEIKLILLGDILEMRSTTKWVASDYEEDGTRKLKYRPWLEDKNSPSKVCKEILDGIQKHNEVTFKYLSPKKFDQVDKNNGLHLLIEELGKNNIKVEYVSGNHDRLINFYEKNSLVKEYVEKKFGWIIPEVSEDHGYKFEDKELGILADHGHKVDFLDYYHNDYNKPPIGALLSDLSGRLMYHVQNEKNEKLIRFCMDIDNVRPSSERFNWVVSNINKLEINDLEVLKEVLLKGISELKQDADEIFIFLYERIKVRFKFFHKIILWIISIFINKKRFLKKFIIKKLNKIEKRLNKTEAKDLKTIFDEVQKLISKWMRKTKKKGQKDQDFHYYVRAEEECKKGFNYIVYGHSHRYKLIPLTTQKNKKIFYFNTGTWKRTVQKNLLSPKAKEPDFQKWTRMTYVSFFNWKSHENKSHIFDVWHGNLQTRDDV